ncbi:MAG: BNR repeat-containing protein, partial [Armatimonadota bacterium]|nr:BNR repeat-containing protein [Armatimonadota bacterium]
MNPDLFSPTKFVACCLAALLVLPSAGRKKQQHTRIIPIEPGWAATSVNAGVFRHHAIFSFRGRQFVSFYDPDGHVTIAFRDLPSEKWTVHHTDWTGNVRDAHNMISMGVSTDGLLHISYDLHCVPLRYRRSAKPLDPTTFGPMIPMTGLVEKRVTCPQFVNLADGTLLFLYRDGVSGSGDLYINRYDVEKQVWQPLQHPLIASAGRYNPYWCRPAVGSDGSLHLAWCWRRHGGAETNNRLCYAKSPDGGRTWQDSRGKPYKLPITPDNAEVIDTVGENSNLSNQDSSEVDSHNRMHIVYRKNDESGVPQYFHQWWDGREWRRTQFSQFTGVFTFKGGGTKAIPMSRPNLLLDDDDRIFVLYRDTRQGSRPTMATAAAPDYKKWNHITLADVDLMQWEPTYDLARWRQERVLD